MNTEADGTARWPAGLRDENELAELLGKRDEDALGTSNVAEPILVLVLRHAANELGAMLLQAGNDVVDVVDGEHDAAYPERVRRCVLRFSADRRRPLELHQLHAAVATRSPQHCDVRSDIVEADHLIDRRSLDCRLALKLETKFDKERDRRGEVVDNDADVVHPPNRHVPTIAQEVWTIGWWLISATAGPIGLTICREVAR
jgi:hypothetical protein